MKLPTSFPFSIFFLLALAAYSSDFPTTSIFPYFPHDACVCIQ